MQPKRSNGSQQTVDALLRIREYTDVLIMECYEYIRLIEANPEDDRNPEIHREHIKAYRNVVSRINRELENAY